MDQITSEQGSTIEKMSTTITQLEGSAPAHRISEQEVKPVVMTRVPPSAIPPEETIIVTQPITKLETGEVLKVVVKESLVEDIYTQATQLSPTEPYRIYPERTTQELSVLVTPINPDHRLRLQPQGLTFHLHPKRLLKVVSF